MEAFSALMDALIDGDLAAGHIPAAGGAAVPDDSGFVNGSVGLDGFCLFCHGAAVPAPLDVRNRVLCRQGGGGQYRQAQGQNAEQAEYPLFRRVPPLHTHGHPNPCTGCPIFCCRRVFGELIF